MSFLNRLVSLLTFMAMTIGAGSSHASVGARACADAFSSRTEETQAYLPIDLPFEIEASGLSQQLAHLKNHSGGVVDMYTFLEKWPSYTHGYLLGFSEKNLIYEAVSNPMGLLGWSDGYFKHRIHPKALNHTVEYMTAIIASGEPIVFLVPRDLMGRSSITQREMLFLLEQPAERLKNVVFVFGAYHFISDEAMDKINRRGGANALRDELRQWAKRHIEP